MKYELTEQQKNELLNILLDLKAMVSYNAITMVSNLPKIEEKKEDVKD